MVKKSERSTPPIKKTPLPMPEEDLPILYEDEESKGQGSPATIWAYGLFYGFQYHLQNRPELQVFFSVSLIDLNAPLQPVTGVRPTVSPEIMVVHPFTPLPRDVESYTIGTDGPAPLLTAEVFSDYSFEDLEPEDKVVRYAALGVKECILADPMRNSLSQQLLLKRLRPDRSWEDLCDADGGITSQLGFRIIVDEDGLPRLLHTANSCHARPSEVESLRRQLTADFQRETKLRREAEEKLRAVEAELQRLREATQPARKANGDPNHD
jgi:hypothetical protein